MKVDLSTVFIEGRSPWEGCACGPHWGWGTGPPHVHVRLVLFTFSEGGGAYLPALSTTRAALYTLDRMWSVYVRVTRHQFRTGHQPATHGGFALPSWQWWPHGSRWVSRGMSYNLLYNTYEQPGAWPSGCPDPAVGMLRRGARDAYPHMWVVRHSLRQLRLRGDQPFWKNKIRLFQNLSTVYNCVMFFNLECIIALQFTAAFNLF